MKTTIIKSVFALIVLALFVSCENGAEITQLTKINFPQTLTSTATSITLTSATDANAVADFNWEKVTYGIEAPVTYSLQIDLPADTSGVDAWSKAAEIEVGEDVYSYSLLGLDLNTIAIESLGLKAGEAVTVVIRVKSYVDRAAFSNAVSFEVTPYKIETGYPKLWIPGDYQGWNPATAETIVSVNSDNIYEGYFNIPAGGTYQFKLTAQAAWEPSAYGDGTAGALIVANESGNNFTAPSDGYYLLWADLNSMTYVLIKTSWSIFGGATPGGWTTDTPMTYDPDTKLWTVTANMLANGSFKFRANNAWQLDFGIDETGKLAYANHPKLSYVDRPHLTVPADGNYTITLDLSVPGEYKYNMIKNF